jgi:hypothetical protein
VGRAAEADLGPEYKLGKLNGRQVISWYEDGKRRRFRFRAGLSQAELNAEVTRFIKDRSKILTKELVTVEDAVQAYIADRRHDGKPTEKQEYSWRALQNTFGALRPGEIDKKLCQRYRDNRLKAGRVVGTVWTELGVMRAALKFALKDKAPAVWLPDKPPPRERYLTREEANRLLAAVESPHLRLFILLALGTAGRHSALLELTWNRVYFDRRQIDLRTAETNRIKRRAVVPMNDTLLAALSEARTAAMTEWVVEYAGHPQHCKARFHTRSGQGWACRGVTPYPAAYGGRLDGRGRRADARDQPVPRPPQQQDYRGGVRPVQPRLPRRGGQGARHLKEGVPSGSMNLGIENEARTP